MSGSASCDSDISLILVWRCIVSFMDSHSMTLVVALILLMMGSAFFSATETAFSSLNKPRLKNMAAEGNKKAKLAYKLAENYDGKAKICKVNTDEQTALSQKYGIRSIPTIFFMKDGKVVDQIIGAVSEAALSQKLDNVLSS